MDIDDLTHSRPLVLSSYHDLSLWSFKQLTHITPSKYSILALLNPTNTQHWTRTGDGVNKQTFQFIDKLFISQWTDTMLKALKWIDIQPSCTSIQNAIQIYWTWME
jgi:hypothetical protein